MTQLSKRAVKVSVIIPVHNQERYLEQCLNSLLVQTFDEFEIICIDDGSSDMTPYILAEYVKNNYGIKLYRNEYCKGAGISRNIGMSYAVGMYLLFLDSDDIFEPNMIEELYSAGISCMADVVIQEHDRFSEEPIMNKKGERSLEYLEQYCRKPFQVSDMSDNGFLTWVRAPWNRMLRKEFVRNYGLEFQDLQCSNDMYIATMSMALAEKIVHTKTHNSLVHYRVNNPTQISAARNPLCTYYACKAIKNKMQLHNIWDLYYRDICAFFMKMMVFQMRSCKSEKLRSAFYIFFQTKGLNELELLKNEKVVELDDDTKVLVNCFLLQKYDTYWFENDILYRTILLQNMQRINDLFEFTIRKKYKVAFWGAGVVCVEFLQYCDDHDLNIDVLIDNDVRKQGSYLAGRQIFSFDVVEAEVQLVLVANFRHFAAIVEQVREKSSEIIIFPLFDYLSNKLNLVECIYGSGVKSTNMCSAIAKYSN